MNYYQILKLSKNATDREIKSSYKKLVKQYHPDLYVGDKEFAEQKIKEINEAYDILSNTKTKAEYDNYLNLQQTTSQTYTSTPPTHTPPEPQVTEWSFSKFIFEKFSKLNKKRQLQIFIALFIFILSLFLINLIQVKHYLTHEPTPSSKNTTQNILEPNITNSPENEFETLDEYFYHLFMQYESNTLYENQF